MSLTFWGLHGYTKVWFHLGLVDFMAVFVRLLLCMLREQSENVSQSPITNTTWTFTRNGKIFRCCKTRIEVIYRSVHPKRNKNMQQVPTAGKYATRTKRAKTWNLCQAQENIRHGPSTRIRNWLWMGRGFLCCHWLKKRSHISFQLFTKPEAESVPLIREKVNPNVRVGWSCGLLGCQAFSSNNC